MRTRPKDPNCADCVERAARINRRQALQLAGAGAGALILAACTPPPLIPGGWDTICAWKRADCEACWLYIEIANGCRGYPCFADIFNDCQTCYNRCVFLRTTNCDIVPALCWDDN